MVTKIVGHFGSVDVKFSFRSSQKAYEIADKLADERRAEGDRSVVVTPAENRDMSSLDKN